jgi:hypothetical protein
MGRQQALVQYYNQFFPTKYSCRVVGGGWLVVAESPSLASPQHTQAAASKARAIGRSKHVRASTVAPQHSAALGRL